MYEVTIDFGDNAVKEPKRFDSETEMALYLEKIPSMFGFSCTREATVNIKRLPNTKGNLQLF